MPWALAPLSPCPTHPPPLKKNVDPCMNAEKIIMNNGGRQFVY